MAYVEHSRLVFPPEQLHRAYLYLVYQVFVLIRSSGRLGAEQGAFATDLADAMHNVTDLLSHYGDGWLDDQKFRKLYLRPFDERWSDHPAGGVSLEAILNQFMDENVRATHSGKAANDDMTG